MADIVVPGAGIGRLSQACELRRSLGKEHRIVVVNDSDHSEFTPSNPWVAVGWRRGDAPASTSRPSPASPGRS